MLSDVGSKVIRAFGILNTNVPEDHRMMYGMPFPGDYLIAPDGTIRDKLFLPSYEHRPSATALSLRNSDGIAGGNSVEIDTDAFSATVTLSADRSFPGQELAIALHIRMKPGWHIYGQSSSLPLPANYRATELIFESPIVGEQSTELPAPKPMLLKALGETLPVYEGEVRAIGKLGIKWSPPMPAKFMEPFGKPIERGHYKIGGTLRFQACSDTVCEAPQAIKFELPLELQAGVPPAPKKPA
jgi:Disulphide bond corrector protein DsbC